MSMPGFTAEVSLRRITGSSYYFPHAILQTGQAVHPAQFEPGDPSCFSECFRECIQEGIPPFQCGPGCRRACEPPRPTCGPCVGFRQCSDGSQRPCSV